MNFNDKFLNVCFKVAKVLFSILLVISLLTCGVFLFKTTSSLLKFNSSKVQYKYDTQIIVDQIFGIDDNNSAKNKTDDKELKNEKKERAIEKKIKKFGKDNNLSEGMTNELIRVIDYIDEKEQIRYFSNFIKFHKSFLALFKAKLKERGGDFDQEIDIDELTSDLYNEYLELYKTEKQEIAEKASEAEEERNNNFNVFLASLGIFVLFLFLPILLKIEENTRK